LCSRAVRGLAGDAGSDNGTILTATPENPAMTLKLPLDKAPQIATRFILINTSHAGNVGAAARAMKTMGFDDMVLVAPRWANVLRREETIQRASGALDVLDKCRIVDTLDEALDGMTHLCATAMTPRDFGPPTVTPRPHFESVIKSIHDSLSKVEQTNHIGRGLEVNFMPETGVAFLFGSERFGMRNEDVYRCHVCLSIPSNPNFGSLNIGAALQVIAYEWRLALGGFAEPVEWSAGARTDTKADAAQVAGLLAHWEQSLTAMGFLNPAAPKKLMPRLNQLFNRAGVTQEEIHILRGIAKMMAQQAGDRATATDQSKG
jgi:tRNA/rRNA methyltransferase